LTTSSLTIRRSTSGDWSLIPSDDLSSSELRAGIDALDELLSAGPKQRISAAILELLAATDRPPSLADTPALARREALKQMAWDYPIDVVEQACRDWRKVQNFGRWWPAEQDLRALCEKIAKPREHLRRAAVALASSIEAQERRGSRARNHTPFGRTDKFYSAVMESHGPAFCKSWLSHRTCEFSEDTIYTIGLAVDRLTQKCGGLLKMHGVKLERCEEVTKRFYADEDARAPSAPPKRRKP
jgi:hypothetical protein